MLALSLLVMTIVPIMALGDGITPGGPCPPGGGNFCADAFSNIILRCTTSNGTNGILQPGNCNDNLAGSPPIGVKTDAICGNSTANNADCFLPPYPSFITVPSSSSSASTITSAPSSTPAVANSTVTTPTTTNSASVSTTKSTAGTATGAVPFVSSLGNVFIPGMSGVGTIVAMIVGGLLL